VKFIDDCVPMSQGIKKIAIEMKNDGQTFTINVLFIPRMKSNLLNLSQLLLERGYTLRLKDKILEVL